MDGTEAADWELMRVLLVLLALPLACEGGSIVSPTSRGDSGIVCGSAHPCPAGQPCVAGVCQLDSLGDGSVPLPDGSPPGDAATPGDAARLDDAREPGDAARPDGAREPGDAARPDGAREPGDAARPDGALEPGDATTPGGGGCGDGICEVTETCQSCPADCETCAPCPASLQSAVDSTASGGTLNVSGCSFAERVTINKAMTLIGATIDGTGLGVALQEGALTLAADNITVANVDVHGSSGAGIRIQASNITIRDSRFHDNVQEGYSCDADNLTFLRGRIDHNNTARTVDPTWEAGGGKCHGDNITFDGVESDHNGGPGIWFDQWYPSPYPADRHFNAGATVRNCRVHDNQEAGIFYEVSDGGPTGTKIYDNVVWSNGTDQRGWYWDAGILISSSRNVEVYGNTLAWNLDGISVLTQSRGDQPPGGTTNVYVHHNNVIMGTPVSGDSSDKGALAFSQDWSGGIYDAAANNRGVGNAFWFPYAEPSSARFGYWNSTNLQTLAALNGVPAGGSASAYLTTAQKDALLTATGIPPQ
jgi:hypothetical protein